MADSTTNLDVIDELQEGIVDRINELVDAASVGTYWGRRGSACVGLTWAYYGGVVDIAGVMTRIANGTLSLTANQANIYIEHTTAGVVSFNTSGFTAGSIPDYKAVTGASTVTSYQDFRAASMALSAILALLDIDGWSWSGDVLTITRNGKQVQLELE